MGVCDRKALTRLVDSFANQPVGRCDYCCCKFCQRIFANTIIVIASSFKVNSEYQGIWVHPNHKVSVGASIGFPRVTLFWKRKSLSTAIKFEDTKMTLLWGRAGAVGLRTNFSSRSWSFVRTLLVRIIHARSAIRVSNTLLYPIVVISFYLSKSLLMALAVSAIISVSEQPIRDVGETYADLEIFFHMYT